MGSRALIAVIAFVAGLTFGWAHATEQTYAMSQRWYSKAAQVSDAHLISAVMHECGGDAEKIFRSW